jgi:uncharacterized protein YcfL
MRRVIAIAVLTALIGCQSVKKEEGPLIKREQNMPQDFVKFLDYSLEQKIKVVSVFKYTDVGLLGFQVNVRLEDSSPLWIEYQAVFYSEDGREIERSFWRPQLLYPNQDIGLPGRAAYPTSKKFIIYIKPYTGQPTPAK